MIFQFRNGPTRKISQKTNVRQKWRLCATKWPSSTRTAQVGVKCVLTILIFCKYINKTVITKIYINPSLIMGWNPLWKDWLKNGIGFKVTYLRGKQFYLFKIFLKKFLFGTRTTFKIRICYLDDSLSLRFGIQCRK